MYTWAPCVRILVRPSHYWYFDQCFHNYHHINNIHGVDGRPRPCITTKCNIGNKLTICGKTIIRTLASLAPSRKQTGCTNKSKIRHSRGPYDEWAFRFLDDKSKIGPLLALAIYIYSESRYSCRNTRVHCVTMCVCHSPCAQWLLDNILHILMEGREVAWVPFTNMVYLYSRHGYIITSIIKCGMNYLIHSQTAIVVPLKFGNG